MVVADLNDYPTAQDLADKIGVSVERVIESIERNGVHDVIGGKVAGVWRVEPFEFEPKRLATHGRLLAPVPTQ